jgi:hypothetical protein
MSHEKKKKIISPASKTKQEGGSPHLLEVGARELGHAEELDGVGARDAAVPICSTVD